MRISKYKIGSKVLKNEELLNEPLEFVDIYELPPPPNFRMQTSNLSLSPILYDWKSVPLMGFFPFIIIVFLRISCKFWRRDSECRKMDES
jgi:hypothetical protein